MKPGQFLALRDAAPQPVAVRPRDYRAGEAGAGRDDYFLTLWCPGGLFYSLPFAQLQLVSGNRAGTVLELTFRMTFVAQGQQLQAIAEGVRLKRITRLHVFDGGTYDPPAPGAPVITSLELKPPPRGG